MWVEHTVQHVVIICQKINTELSLSEFCFCLSITIIEGFGGDRIFAFLSLLCNFLEMFYSFRILLILKRSNQMVQTQPT